jgi:hypothetical protein
MVSGYGDDVGKSEQDSLTKGMRCLPDGAGMSDYSKQRGVSSTPFVKLLPVRTRAHHFRVLRLKCAIAKRNGRTGPMV